MSMEKRTVLVTGVSGTNTGTQVLSALAMLPESYRLTCTDISPLAYGNIAVESFHQVPPASSPNYLEKLLSICERESVSAVAPGSEPELSVLAPSAEHLKEHGVTLLANNARVVETCQDKIKTVDALEKAGIRCPATAVVDLKRPAMELAELLTNQISFPMVLKPYRGTGGSANLYLSQDVEELVAVLTLCRLHGGLDIMAQEYVGSPEAEYTVGVMSGPDGKSFSSIALKRRIQSTLTRKIHVLDRYSPGSKSYLTISSGVSEGHVGEYPRIRAFAEKAANALVSTGPLNIQCRDTARGVMIFEINPRFSGTTSIRALCGHNDPDLIIRRHILGETVQQARYIHGQVFRSLRNTLIKDNHEV